jgi:predicted enzyme related to lactoylglutathione lyase
VIGVMQPQPMVVLADVEAGSGWFQAVLGLSSGHGGSEYEMLMDGDTMVAQLHDWEADEHPHMGDPAEPSRGNGVLLWFATDDFDAVMRRVTEREAVVLEGPLANTNSGQREVWLQGPEGYVVVVAGPH